MDAPQPLLSPEFAILTVEDCIWGRNIDESQKFQMATAEYLNEGLTIDQLKQVALYSLTLRDYSLVYRQAFPEAVAELGKSGTSEAGTALQSIKSTCARRHDTDSFCGAMLEEALTTNRRNPRNQNR